MLACHKIRAQRDFLLRSIIVFGQAKDQWRACVVVPDFNSIDAMPMAAHPVFEKEIDAGSAWSPVACFICPSLAVISAFWMRLELQAVDDILCCHV